MCGLCYVLALTKLYLNYINSLMKSNGGYACYSMVLSLKFWISKYDHEENMISCLLKP